MMAAVGLRLRRSLTSPILIATFQQNTIQPNPQSHRTYAHHANANANESKPKPKPKPISCKFSCLPHRMGICNPIANANESNRSREDLLTYRGCDYNHWMIVMDMDLPYILRKPKVEIYVQTAAKVLGSVEEAKKKIYAVSGGFCSFQIEVSEQVAQQFKALPGVRQVLPDSYIDPENKEYGGDKYINGTIIPRPPKRGRDMMLLYGRKPALSALPVVGNPGIKGEQKKKSP